jgi:hypothetical protein
VSGGEDRLWGRKGAATEHMLSMMLTSVCGPLALSLDTRAAVREVNTAQNVYNGQAPIELSVEKFGW